MKEKIQKLLGGPGAVIAWMLVLFAVSYFPNQRNNGFPFYYHPDEPGKVEQLRDRKWNFHHPMLLLSTTMLFARHPAAGQEQQVVETGRRVSAGFTALAVVALSLTALLWRGWPAAFVAGAALATHHQ